MGKKQPSDDRESRQESVSAVLAEMTNRDESVFRADEYPHPDWEDLDDVPENELHQGE